MSDESAPEESQIEQNFHEKLEALNRVNLTDSEFARLRDEIINADERFLPVYELASEKKY